MESNIKELDTSQVLITIKTTTQESEPYYKKALHKLSANLTIKGFRKGHIPEEVVLQHISKEGIEIEMLEMMVQAMYMDAVKEHNIRPIASPSLEIKGREPFVFELTVDVFPKVSVKNIDSVKVKSKDINISEKDITESIEMLREQNADYKKVERAAKKGDRIEIDFEGFVDGKAFEGGASKHHPVIIGKNMMIPGFEDQLVGLKQDEKKRIKVPFPKDYHVEELKGKKAEFEINVHQVDEIAKPPLDDAFAKKLTGNEEFNVEKLKEEVKMSLEHKEKHDEQHRIESEVIDQIIKKTSVIIPKTLLQEELGYMWMQFDKRLQSQGMDADKYLEAQNKTKDDVFKQWEKEAESRVTLRLALAQLAEDLSIAPDEKQVEAVLAQLPKNERQMKKAMVELQVKLDTTLQHIIKTALA